jgi:hypothetical protein
MKQIVRGPLTSNKLNLSRLNLSAHSLRDLLIVESRMTTIYAPRKSLTIKANRILRNGIN